MSEAATPNDLPLISLEHAYISQVNNLVLSDVNMSIYPGDFVYLIGATGSGKSSLLKTLYADLPLKEGKASVVGFDLDKLKEKDIPFLRRKIGIVFQDFQLLPDRSVRDNLLFVLKATGWKDKKKIDDRIRYVLERVDMGTKHFKMPHQLSGGEQQRIAIARALLNDPELIIADEPTGNLDPSTSEEIMLLMKEICSNGRAILMATHDYSLILKFPSRTLKCEDGKIFETLQTRL
jgi:cell division transport system ATP-binding protein